MKKKTCLMLLLGVVVGFTACQADVDLNNIDTTVGGNVRLLAPAGTIHMSLGDMLGHDSVAKYISVREDGVLVYCDTFNLDAYYRKVNFAEYIPVATKRYTLVDHQVLPDVYPAGTELQLVFPMVVDLQNLNDALESDRMDSVQVAQARFTSNVTISDLNLKYEDIQSFKIRLDENFRRPSGSEIDIPLTGMGYGQEIPIIVSDFSLNFMADKTLPPSDDNVLDEIRYDLVFDITLSEPMEVKTTSVINYTVQVEVLDYNAIWGFVKPGTDMREAAVKNIGDHISFWNTFNALKVPLAEPTLELIIETAVAGPLKVADSYLFVSSAATKERKFATFNGSERWDWSMPNYLDPHESPLDARERNSFLFTKAEDRGCVDKMFALYPDSLGYDFTIEPDMEAAARDDVKQYRITRDTKVHAEVVANAPFIFNEGLDLNYVDTTGWFYIEGGMIDSIIDNFDTTKVDLHSLQVIFHAENTIPFDIDLGFHFLDEDLNVIDAVIFPADSNHIVIAGATEVDAEGRVIEPEVTRLVFDIDSERAERLRHIRKIAYDASLKGKNTVPVTVLDESGLNVKMALGIDADVVVDLDSIFTYFKGGDEVL